MEKSLDPKITTGKIINLMCLTLSIIYCFVMLIFLVINPYNFIYNIWRFPILGIKYYSPYVHDILLFGIFSIILCYQKEDGYLGLLITWFIQEVFFNWTNILNWKTFALIDGYFYFKVAFFTMILIFLILVAVKTKYHFTLNRYTIGCFILYWFFWTITQSYFPIPDIQTITFLIVMYQIVGYTK